MYYTNEYTVLKSQDGNKDIVIKPGIVNSFQAIEGKFISTSYARVLSVKTNKAIAALNPGKIFDGIGEKPKKRTRK